MKFSLAFKVFASCCLFTIPIGVLSHMNINIQDADIQFAEQEKRGNAYLRVLQELTKHVSLAHAYSLLEQRGDKSSVAKLQANKERVSRDFISLDQVNQRFGNELLFSDLGLKERGRIEIKPENLISRWSRDIDSGKNNAFGERDNAFRNYLDQLQLAITHVGDTSNLILDPDLDSYYVMDATLLAIPSFQDRLQRFATRVMSYDPSQPIQTEELLELKIRGALLEADLKRIKASTATAISEDKNFYGTSDSLQSMVPKVVDAYLDKAINLVKQIADLKVGDSSATAFNLIPQALNLYEESFGVWHELTKELDTLLDTRTATFTTKERESFVIATTLVLGALILAFLLSRSLSREFVSRTNALSDEANQVYDASSKLNAATKIVTSASTQQAAAIHETVSSMAEIRSMTKQTLKETERANQTAISVSKDTERGKKVIADMVTTMKLLQETNTQLQDITNIINEIDGKAKIINEIVFKTQLLSFNASIESARAGQHGRGFAVVAEEVGHLAQNSGLAAKEIEALLADSKQRVESIVQITQDRITEGQEVSEHTQSIFVNIASQIDSILDQVLKVNNASKEQQLGIDQVNQAMIQMSEANRNTNSVAEETESLADAMSSQSSKLQAIGHQLEELVLGTSNAKKHAESTKKLNDDRIVANSKTPNSPDLAKEEPSKSNARTSAGKVSRDTITKDLIKQSADAEMTADDGSFNRHVS